MNHLMYVCVIDTIYIYININDIIYLYRDISYRSHIHKIQSLDTNQKFGH